MRSDEENKPNKAVHYDEHGIPIFDANRRLSEIESEQAEAKKRDTEYRDEQLKLDRRMVLFTFLLVLTSAATGGISIWQGTIAQQSAGAAKSAADAAKDNAEAAKKQAAAAEATVQEMRSSSTDTHALAIAAGRQAGGIIELAGETKRSANIAQQALDNQDRPWIGMKSINVKEDIVAGKDIPVSSVFENVGRGPAKHVINVVSSYMMCTPTTPETMPIPTLKSDPSSIFMLPGATAETDEIKVKIPEERFPDLINPITGCKLYIYGYVNYCDLNNRPHYRHYCGFWKSGTKRDILQCAKYNDGDEDKPEVMSKMKCVF